MKGGKKTKSELNNPFRYVLMLSAIWTLVVFVSMGWNIIQLNQYILRAARTSAEISYEKDLIYRRWVALQGGVYVPVSEMTPPNPYLNVPDRDVKTSAGLSLTMMNPAYMTRQVNELALEARNFRGHITSLNPIRPENSPDPWERESLESFEKGNKETGSIQMTSGKEYFRFMRPFVSEESCLKCHEFQGYKVGDIRGGISISIPMEPWRVIERARIGGLTFAHGFLWIIGLLGLGIVSQRLRRQTYQREKAEEEVYTLSITDQLTGLHNRRGFLFLVEQQFRLSDRMKKKMQLFFADLDGLKRINDTLGHNEGDNALIESAVVLKETFRSSDIIARMGGDEFAVLAIDTNGLHPEILTGRLQSLVDAHNNQKNRKFKLSVSMGYSSYDPENPSSIDNLLEQADRLMYEQKKTKNVSEQDVP